MSNESGKKNAETSPNGGKPQIADVPEWLTESVFEKFLKENVAGFKKIQEFKPKRALAAGENYATIMLRIEIVVELEDGKTKPLSFMMKTPLTFMDEFMKNFDVFELELSMYKDVIPEIEQIYKDAGINITFGAKHFNIKTPAGISVVLLEDLRPRGFKNVNRLEGLDMKHAKCVLKKLAQWHAGTATRAATKGEFDDKLMIGFFAEGNLPMVKQFFSGLGTSFMKCVNLYEGHEEYLESLENLQSKSVDAMFEAGKTDPNEFNVLNHGDCWSNNIMFQYDESGEIKETYFVDFQIPKYGSPAQDLLYFILSSTQYEIKLDKFEHLIKFYHDHLIEHLKILKYPKKLPTLKEIHMALIKYGIWGYSTVTGVMGAILLDPNENANLDNFLSESDDGKKFKTLMYTNDRYRKHIQVLLPWLHNRGAFEC